MRPGTRLAMLVAAVAVAGSCTADSPAEPVATNPSTTRVSRPPATTEVGPAATPSFIPLATPARIEPITGRWFQTNLGLDRLLVIPRGLIWDGNNFYLMQRVAFGDMRVWRSVDALTWEELPTLGTFTMEEGGPYTLLSHGDRLVAGGRNGIEATVWIYEGASPWREVSLGITGQVTSLAVAGPNLVAFGDTPYTPPINEVIPGRHATIWTSSDGVSWTEVAGADLFGEYSRAVGVASFGDGVVAVANRSSVDADGRVQRHTPLLLKSRDGMQWQALDVNLGEIVLHHVAGGDELRLHSRTSVFQSTDGESWTQLLIHRSGIAGESSRDDLSWFKGHAVATGATIREGEQSNQIRFPAAWVYMGEGDWKELEPLDAFANPGTIGAGTSGGDRFVANGFEDTDTRDHEWSLYTFVIEFPADYLAPTWVNQTGLGQTDPAVWRERLDRACTDGVWEDEVALRLADEFIAEDLPLSVRDDGATPPTAEAAQALWLMALNYCRADFPAGEIGDGPPAP